MPGWVGVVGVGGVVLWAGREGWTRYVRCMTGNEVEPAACTGAAVQLVSVLGLAVAVTVIAWRVYRFFFVHRVQTSLTKKFIPNPPQHRIQASDRMEAGQVVARGRPVSKCGILESLIKNATGGGDEVPDSLYDINAKTLEGDAYDMGSLRDRVVLITNVASK